MARLVSTVEMKDQGLDVVWSSHGDSHKEIQFLFSLDALLARQLTNYTSFTVEAVSQSFENVMDEVEYFHHPLTLSREQIHPDQVVIDGKIVPLWK